MPARRNDLVEDRAIGERLRAVRLKQGLRPEVVAGRLGMSVSNFGRYEGGWNSLGATQFRPFADALGVSVRELINELFPDLDNEIATGTSRRADHFRSEQPARLVTGLLTGASA